MHLTFINKVHLLNLDSHPSLFTDLEIMVGKIFKSNLGHFVFIVSVTDV